MYRFKPLCAKQVLNLLRYAPQAALLHLIQRGNCSYYQIQDKSSDPDKKSMSADPGEVVVEGVRREAAWHESRVVDAHDRVEQHLLQTNVEVRLQNLENDVIDDPRSATTTRPGPA